jgi:Na+/phosphate symporter
MIRNWTLHLKTDEEKERFKREILSARGVLERLGEILQAEQDDIHNKERNTKIYSLPNWDYIQAHYNGYVDCLKHIQFLINLDQQDNGQSISGQ